MLGVLTMKGKQTESNKEITIVGVVREIKDYGKQYRVGIAAGNDLYVVRPNEEKLSGIITDRDIRKALIPSETFRVNTLMAGFQPGRENERN